MSDDWGGDYSMILHNVEDKLDHHLDDNISSSRKRIRAESLSIIDQDGDSFNQSIGGSSSMLRLNLQLDEIKIRNEELLEKLTSQSSDFARQKEKYIRQLEFMENDNAGLKAELEAKKEKYYAVKKKLQSTIRAADSEKQALTQQILQLSQSKNSSTSSEVNVDTSAIWEGRLNALEASITMKSSEVRNLSLKNAELEERCAVLQHKLVAAHSDISEGDTMTTARSLQKQVSDLESLLRRRSREVEKLENQLKNQHLLEQDLSSCNQKLLNLRTASKALQDVEAKYNVLLKEKDSWTIYFQDIVGQLESSRPSIGGDADESEPSAPAREVTPVLVLRLLSNVQSRCASLLRAQCELDSKNSELRSQLVQNEAALKEAVASRVIAEESANRVNQSNALLKQQVQLYESEVMSLRALLKTFDAEVAILEGRNRSSRNQDRIEGTTGGGEATEALCRAKDAVIQELRTEVDSLRAQCQTGRQQIAEAQAAAQSSQNALRRLREGGETEGVRSEFSSWQNEKKALKQKCEDLLVELLALQKVAGIDFIPGKTKVLHINHAFNPSLLRHGLDPETMRTGCTSFMTPLEELKHLRKEVKMLRSQVASVSNVASSGVGPVSLLDTSVSMGNTSMVAASAGSSVGGVDASKLNTRLKEMFKERINAYREAVYLLFGFKVDLFSADIAGGGLAFPQLKLRSMYAESPDDSLVFQMKGNSLELMETPFATGLDETLIRTLQTSNAVPVFLANVSLDLFERQTFLG